MGFLRAKLDMKLLVSGTKKDLHCQSSIEDESEHLRAPHMKI